MRTILILFCLFLIAPPTLACPLPVDYQPIEQRYQKGVIFKITTCDGKTNYILGTMHSDSPAIESIYDDASAILAKSDNLGLEFIEDDTTPAIAQHYMMFPPTQTFGLDALISAQDFSDIAKSLAMRAGLPEQSLRRMRPWAAAILLQLPPDQSNGMVLDKRLQNDATFTHKTLFGLETAAEQYAIFSPIPQNQQLAMLKDATANMATQDAVNAKFEAAYVKRDLKTLGAMADESFNSMSDKNLRQYLKTHLLRNRNHKMAERMQAHLIKGNTLIAIGALHLMSEDGVLPLLEKQGYQIEIK